MEEFVVVELKGYLVGFFAASVMFWHGAAVVVIASALKRWKLEVVGSSASNACNMHNACNESRNLCLCWRTF